MNSFGTATNFGIPTGPTSSATGFLGGFGGIIGKASNFISGVTPVFGVLRGVMGAILGGRSFQSQGLNTNSVIPRPTIPLNSQYCSRPENAKWCKEKADKYGYSMQKTYVDEKSTIFSNPTLVIGILLLIFWKLK